MSKLLDPTETKLPVCFHNILNIIMHCNLIEFLLVFGSILLLAFLLSELMDWGHLITSLAKHRPVVNYGYSHEDGPHTWRNKYPESLGQSQSPVNIVSHQAVIIHPSTDLVWHRHRSQPMSMTLMNDGHTALLHVTYLPEQRPQISGGSLNASYELFSLMFHWGPSDDEGSEHTIDSHRFPLELQMIYHKTGFSQPLDAVVVGDKTGILIVAYLFEVKNASLYIYSMTPVVYWSEFPATDADVPLPIRLWQLTPVDNPYLDPLVNNLRHVINPGSAVKIDPFPMSWFYPEFNHCYYSYHGSLTYPPCSELVTWIIQPEPVAISPRQVTYIYFNIYINNRRNSPYSWTCG
uniref:Alpha-carbonic anhydrase domain-containing protein n=1 Tax=Timema bartmani TaxID=61472 RepID=A0A7R9EQG6_9NEOP|nr:unnamed protein product [Timema bartmani]